MKEVLRSAIRLAHVAWRATSSLTEYAYLRLKLRRSLSYSERALWLQRCCRKILPHLGFKVAWHGTPPTSGLLVSNHLSYMDILAFSSITPCCFLSKVEVRRWPVFGLVAQTAGTIFLDRRNPAALLRANEELGEMLAQGTLVIVFPEGTTSDGSSVLPFHASLFQAAVNSEVAFTPAYITYSVSDGSLAEDVCFWRDMTLVPHLLNLLSKRTLQAFVSFAPAEKGFQSRKEAAERMYSQVIALAAAQEGSPARVTTVSSTPQVAVSDHAEIDASI
ncbi:MAG TPA: lysophospholipid acyltransferase family protein [Terriglobales bacterium]|nr:lysophospholipid acyltransferase family protein [Terriglobales bacterium]